MVRDQRGALPHSRSIWPDCRDPFAPLQQDVREETIGTVVAARVVLWIVIKAEQEIAGDGPEQGVCGRAQLLGWPV